MAGDEQLSEPLFGGEVQVGEHHLACAYPVVLLGDGFLNLEDQVATEESRKVLALAVEL